MYLGGCFLDDLRLSATVTNSFNLLRPTSLFDSVKTLDVFMVIWDILVLCPSIGLLAM